MVSLKASLIVAIIFSLTVLSSEAQTTVSPSYSGSLTSSSQSYTRKGATGSFYYQAIQVRVPVIGEYIIQSTSANSFDTYGYLYQGNFYPTYPQYNIVGEDDQTGGNNQFKITASLRPDLVYILIVTTYEASKIGTFGVNISGPGAVSMFAIRI